MQDMELHVLDVSYNSLTAASCQALSAALAKPLAARGAGSSGPGASAKPNRPQTPAKGFYNCLQELNLSGNPIGKRFVPASSQVLLPLLLPTSPMELPTDGIAHLQGAH